MKTIYNAIVILVALTFFSSNSNAQCATISGESEISGASSLSESPSSSLNRTHKKIENFFGVNTTLTVEREAGGICVEPGRSKYLHGKITIGEKLLDKFSSSWIELLLAHEIGHVLEYTYGAKGLDDTEKELLADAYAGYYYYVHYGSSSSIYESAGIYGNVVGDLEYASSKHHGKPQWRAAAFWFGILAAAENRANTNKYSSKFLHDGLVDALRSFNISQPNWYKSILKMRPKTSRTQGFKF